MYADSHAHNAIKSFVKGLPTVYHTTPHTTKDGGKRSNFKTYNQADPKSLKKGNVGLNFVTLLPVEEVFFDTKIVRLLASQGFTVGLKPKWTKRLYKDYPTYRKMLDAELAHLLTIKKHKNPRMRDHFIFVKKKGDLTNPGKCRIVLNVEGLHAFRDTENYSSPNSLASIARGIDYYKKHSNIPIFSIGLSHFEYNHLVGQPYSIPLPGVVRKLKAVAPLDVKPGDDTITQEAEKIILQCLDKRPGAGKRILLDIKHASPKTREAYYALIKCAYRKNKIPIICSHSAVSGIKTLAEAKVSSDANDAWKAAFKKYGQRMFNPWPINLCDEDIKTIMASKGMIGIELDQRVLGDMRGIASGGKPYYVKDVEDKLAKTTNLSPAKYRHTVMFMDNLLHIIKVAGKKEAWSHVCLGSDFDGLIDPVDACPTATYLRRFENDCKVVARKYYGYGKGGVIDHLLSGLSIEQALKKLFHQNLMQFTRKHFPA